MAIIQTIILACACALVAWVLARRGNGRMSANNMLLQKENDTLKAQATELQQEAAKLRQEHTLAVTERERYATQAEASAKQVEQLQAANASMKEEHRHELDAQAEKMNADFARQTADLKALYEKQKEELSQHYSQQLDELRSQQARQMEQQSALIKEQINTASEAILKKRSDELSSKNTEQLSAILNPLQEKLKQMREAVERTDRDQADRMVKLDATIKENLRQAQEVGERADKLAQALTSENKVQGNFGELQLRTLLENMGLEEGVQFEEQTTMRDENGQSIYEDENGHRMIPDVILHFPDSRDVVIDAKMSLKAFEDYHSADTDEQRADALERHILSVRNHVKELAAKKYYQYTRKGKAKLDFVMMYVFSESALQLALTNAPDLWKSAYDQGVIISGSQTLYMMLRVLEMTWRQVRQAENQEEIMQTANELVNRVQMFYERFQTADDMLTRTRKAFDDVKTTTAPTGKSIATAANKLLKMGAKENTKRKMRLPQPAADDADAAVESTEED